MQRSRTLKGQAAAVAASLDAAPMIRLCCTLFQHETAGVRHWPHYLSRLDNNRSQSLRSVNCSVVADPAKRSMGAPVPASAPVYVTGSRPSPIPVFPSQPISRGAEETSDNDARHAACDDLSDGMSAKPAAGPPSQCGPDDQQSRRHHSRMERGDDECRTQCAHT